MDREWLVGSAAVGLLGFSLGFTGAALYDGIIRYPEWKRTHDAQSIVSYEIDGGKTVSTQMEPSWSLYVYLPAAGTLVSAGAFAFAHRRPREQQASGLVARVNPATQ